MPRLIAILLVLVTLTGCNGRWVNGQWIEEVAVPVVATCPGGRVDLERRTVDVINGRARNTVVRTNACLD
jgi:hypothetical protein